VHLTRDLSAPLEQVWRAWTEAEQVRRWFGSDPRGTVRSAELDVRPGGRFAVTFVDGDGLEHTCRGTYLVVEPMQRLAFTWTWDSEPGVETEVRLVLRPARSGTEMSFEHARLSPISAHDYEAGWSRTFDKLEEALRSGR
jgi:uncharacterized protein YndB with AHSA1/START domain